MAAYDDWTNGPLGPVGPFLYLAAPVFGPNPNDGGGQKFRPLRADLLGLEEMPNTPEWIRAVTRRR